MLWYGMSNVLLLELNLGITNSWDQPSNKFFTLYSRYSENCVETKRIFLQWRLCSSRDLTVCSHIHSLRHSEEIMKIHSFIKWKYTFNMNAFIIYSCILHSSIHLFSYWFIGAFIKITSFGSIDEHLTDYGIKGKGNPTQNPFVDICIITLLNMDLLPINLKPTAPKLQKLLPTTVTSDVNSVKRYSGT